MTSDPAEFVGVVVEPIDDERNSAYGACFAVGDNRHWLTPDHVIEAALERGARALHVLVVNRLMPTVVVAVFRNETCDMALLLIEDHYAHIEPCVEFRDAVVGEEVSLVNPKAREIVTTSVVGHWHISPTSTAAARGSIPVPDGARVLNYSFSAVGIDDRGLVLGHGFSGSPVWAHDGAIVGMYSQQARAQQVGFASHITPALLADLVNQTKEHQPCR